MVSACLLFHQEQIILSKSLAHTRVTMVVPLGSRYPSMPEEAKLDLHPQTERSLPPLSLLIGDDDVEIKDDVQFLMDFAIIGHPKTATTTTLGWFATHDEIRVHPLELHALQLGKPAEHVRIMYNLTQGSEKVIRGYKAPRDIGNPKVLHALNEYWPRTKLIVGIRHPVLWFESFYNFRVRCGVAMPPAQTLLGRCTPESFGVCTDEAMFHIHLSYLGKTDLKTDNERKLLRRPLYKNLMRLPSLPNPLFLYEISQLRGPDEVLVDQYRKDVSEYLGLSQLLGPIPEAEPTDRVKALDICEEMYKEIRVELMKHARAASLWIRNYLLPHPDIRVSSKEHFVQLLKQWMVDPCTEAIA